MATTESKPRRGRPRGNPGQMKPVKDAPKPDKPQSVEGSREDDNAQLLINHMRETGTGADRCDRAQAYVEQNNGFRGDDDKLTCLELFEWMCEDEDLFKSGTLNKTGRFIFGDSYVHGMHGHKASETLENLQRQLADAKQENKALQAENQALRQRVDVLKTNRDRALEDRTRHPQQQESESDD